MKKRILCVLCAALMLLTACGTNADSSAQSGGTAEEEPKLTVLATTYPVYLMAKTVTEGVDDVQVQRLNTGNISCLHDYTLSVNDMKMIEDADVIAINGVGLETFMEDALAASDAVVIDCSEGVELLENLAHHHEEGDEHDHGHYDPHIWLDPANVNIMMENIASGLGTEDVRNAPDYVSNTVDAKNELDTQADAMRNTVAQSALENIGLITFHDGFQYFARAFGFDLLAAIEEEAGSEASAKEINEISELVKAHQIPMIFTEKNGSDATAQAIARETGCTVGQLDMLMSGEGTSMEDYIAGLNGNIQAIVSGFGADQG